MLFVLHFRTFIMEGGSLMGALKDLLQLPEEDSDSDSEQKVFLIPNLLILNNILNF